MSWWNSDWSYRKKLTINNADQGELSDFPVLVKLTTDNFTFAHAKSAGADIRFVDDNDSTELKYEIEKWTDDTEAWIWVKVPTINGSSATDFIYMYFGNAGASDNQDAVNTWDSYFKAVYHLNKSSGSVVDSKGAHGGTVIGAPTRDVAGQIDKAFSFDGIDDAIEAPYHADWDFGAGDFTVEAWIKWEDNDNATIVGWHKGDACGGWCVAHDGTGLRVWNYILGWEGITHHLPASSGTWYYVVFRGTGGYNVLFQDGVVTTNAPSQTGAITNSDNSKLFIGARYNGTGAWFDDAIDEVRVSKGIARSDDWIKAQYLSMTLAFITFGAEDKYLISVGDTGAGADTKKTGNPLATYSRSETGSGVEHILDRALVLISELGTGVDTILSLLGKVVSESGTGVENSYLHILEGVKSSSDTGEGAEASSLVALFQRDEIGEGVEAVVARALYAKEYPTGAIDLAKVLTATLTGAETGTGAEASLQAYYQKKDDSGAGVDSSTLEALFSRDDVGAGAEAITLLAAMVSHDTGVGVEVVIEFFRKLIDSGEGEENLHLIGYVGRAMKLITYLRAYSDLVVYTKPYSDLRVYTSETKH